MLPQTLVYRRGASCVCAAEVLLVCNTTLMVITPFTQASQKQEGLDKHRRLGNIKVFNKGKFSPKQVLAFKISPESKLYWQSHLKIFLKVH